MLGLHIPLPLLLKQHGFDGVHGSVEAELAKGHGHRKLREGVIGVEGAVDLGDEVGAAALVNGLAGERAEGVVGAGTGEGVLDRLVPRRDCRFGGGRCSGPVRGDAFSHGSEEAVELDLDGAFNVDVVPGGVIVDQRQVNVDRDPVHGKASGLDVLIGDTEDAIPFPLEVHRLFQEGDVLTAEANAGAEPMKRFEVRGLVVDAVIKGLHAERYAIG